MASLPEPAGGWSFHLSDIEAQFAQAMRDYGLEPKEIVPDGKFHRFPGVGKPKGNDSGWYVLHADGLPAGAFGDYSSGFSGKWCAKSNWSMSPKERADFKARIEKSRLQALAQREKEAAGAAASVRAKWDSAGTAAVGHPYVAKKHINPYRARVLADGRLMLLVQDAKSVVRSAQYIDADGAKKFEPRGVVGGCYSPVYGIEKIAPDTPVLVCEGWATACTLHEATGYAVAAALSAGNLLPVARALREKFGPDRTIIVCAEDDWSKPENVGLVSAGKAAAAVGARLAIPTFGEGREPKQTDFNDMAIARGIESVRNAVANAQEIEHDDASRPDSEEVPGQHGNGPARATDREPEIPRGKPAQLPTGAGETPSEADGAPIHEERVPVEVYAKDFEQPSAWLDPFPGPMETLFKLSLRRQQRQQPALTVAAALAAMSACMHGRYALPDGLRGNLYVVGLAGSTAGKSGPLNLVKALVSIAGGVPYSNVGSGQGIEDAISRDTTRRAALVIDEVAHLIGAFSSRDAAHYMMHVGKMLLDFYSASEGIYTTRLLADETKQPKKLFNPYMTLYGTTTPAKMAGISPGLIEDGTLGRCLVVRGEDFVYQIETDEMGSLHRDIAHALGESAQRIYQFGPIMTEPDDGILTMKISSEARMMIRGLQAHFDEIASKAENVQRVLCGRAVEQIKRIALVLSVWDNDVGAATRVEVRHIEWARDFVAHSQQCLMSFVESMTDDPIVTLAAKVEKIMRDAVAGNGPFEPRYRKFNAIAAQEGIVGKAALIKKLKVQSKTMEEVMRHMVQSGTVEFCGIETGAARGRRVVDAYRLL